MESACGWTWCRGHVHRKYIWVSVWCLVRGIQTKGKASKYLVIPVEPNSFCCRRIGGKWLCRSTQSSRWQHPVGASRAYPESTKDKDFKCYFTGTRNSNPFAFAEYCRQLLSSDEQRLWCVVCQLCLIRKIGNVIVTIHLDGNIRST